MLYFNPSMLTAIQWACWRAYKYVEILLCVDIIQLIKYICLKFIACLVRENLKRLRSWTHLLGSDFIEKAIEVKNTD